MTVRRYRISIQKTDRSAKPWSWTTEWLCHTTWKVQSNGTEKTFDKALRAARHRAKPYRPDAREAGHYEEFSAYERGEIPALVESRLGCDS